MSHPGRKSLLITGAGGLIGSAVSRYVLTQADENVKALFPEGVTLFLAGRDRERMQEKFPEWREGEEYDFVPFDAAGTEPLNTEADYIIYAAGYGDPASIQAKPVETMLAHFAGLQRVLDAAKRAGTKRVLYVSSSEVYGLRNDTDAPYKETDYGFVDLLDARNSYPNAKRAAETLCVSYAKEYGVDVVIVRPGHVYGEGVTEKDSRAHAQFARQAATGEPIVMKSAGTQLRSYVYAEDCASAILTVLAKGACGQAYNISNPSSVVTIRQMAQAFAAAGGVEIHTEEASAEEQKSYNRMDNSSLDSAKLLSLGWRPKYSMEEGAKKTVEGMRQGVLK